MGNLIGKGVDAPRAALMRFQRSHHAIPLAAKPNNQTPNKMTGIRLEVSDIGANRRGGGIGIAKGSLICSRAAN
jgi:hypothetical protein